MHLFYWAKFVSQMGWLPLQAAGAEVAIPNNFDRVPLGPNLEVAK
jgi:hypothetical protein